MKVCFNFVKAFLERWGCCVSWGWFVRLHSVKIWVGASSLGKPQEYRKQ